jgi:hypothetical protein
MDGFKLIGSPDRLLKSFPICDVIKRAELSFRRYADYVKGL